MSSPLTPPKRPYDRNLKEPNGRGKRQKLAGQIQASKSYPGSVVIRVLCPASKTGSVIGKGGSIISQIRQETGAKIRVEETVPGCDERIVIIMASEKETEINSEQIKEDEGAEADATEETSMSKAADATEEDDKTKDGDDKKEESENDQDKNSDNVEDLNSGKEISSVQKALSLVFERIVEGDKETDGVDEEIIKSSTFILRLLVLSSQVGCLLGKGGSVIKQMSAESGSQIRILPRDKLPLCASASDELVQITGEVEAVRKALQSVSQQLLENPPRDHDSFPGNTIGPSFHSSGHPRAELYPTHHSFGSQGASLFAGPQDSPDFHSTVSPFIPKFHDSGLHGRMTPQEIITFRLMCPDERVGGVIGKGGTIIKSLQLDTGCEIKVMEGVPDSEDRIIVISGPLHSDGRISAAQEAILRVQTRIVRGTADSKEKTVIARLLVSSNQIGCLLGKGGSIIAEMRKSSGAYIRILGKDQIPLCASEGEEVVQINGDFEAVQEALMQITARLQHHFFREAFPSIDHHSNPAFLDQVPPFHPHMGRRELSPPGMYHNIGPSFQGGQPRHGDFHLHDDRLPFMQTIHRPGMPPHISGRKPWGPQGLIEGGGPLGLPEFSGPPHRRILGFGGSQPAIITSTTVEVVVPSSLVPTIYGEDGGCLKQIRQISDAKITITEPNPGAAETVIIISGTPEQTHAAQSLIQAFVMSEKEST
ncbi:KH_1 domain-containing protein [Cephalotus follicularis]|uniref:KH_1 domain-containing protein n=1 Tax=Cephalotus follicularis TaxID=3775 RepID=A0A1Q3BPU6_CEPFO|nr:KH_1 domain-containing protein [Cephalotus follicularis]